jgi:hypothetical protein
MEAKWAETQPIRDIQDSYATESTIAHARTSILRAHFGAILQRPPEANAKLRFGESTQVEEVSSIGGKTSFKCPAKDTEMILPQLNELMAASLERSEESQRMLACEMTRMREQANALNHLLTQAQVQQCEMNGEIQELHERIRTQKQQIEALMTGLTESEEAARARCEQVRRLTEIQVQSDMEHDSAVKSLTRQLQEQTEVRKGMAVACHNYLRENTRLHQEKSVEHETTVWALRQLQHFASKAFACADSPGDRSADHLTPSYDAKGTESSSAISAIHAIEVGAEDVENKPPEVVEPNILAVLPVPPKSTGAISWDFDDLEEAKAVFRQHGAEVKMGVQRRKIRHRLADD